MIASDAANDIFLWNPTGSLSSTADVCLRRTVARLIKSGLNNDDDNNEQTNKNNSHVRTNF